MAAESKAKHIINLILRYTVLILVGFVMVYPLLWMVGATFKSNAEIFSSIGLFTAHPSLDGYKAAMQNYGGTINVWKAMLNTFSYVIPKVVFTMISATITAYGFGRFEFKGRGFLFAVMMATLFLPQVVLNVPQFILFSKLGWVDSKLYLPIIVPTLFATDTYFVFMLVQFLRNVPKELDEAARIDGSGEFHTFNRIVLPIMKPAIAVQAIFTFVGSWNNYFVPALVIQSKNKMTVPILIATLRGADYMNFDMGKIYMMITVAIVPIIIVYLLLSKYIIAGVTLGGVKE